MKISSQAVDSYVEAMRRRYQRDMVKAVEISPTYTITIYDPEQAIAEQRGETARPVVTTPAPLLGEDPGSLERFRRVFATWDFRNGA